MACFGQFLCDHKMATSFARYMHSIYSEEELEFWLDVELFRLDTRRCKRQLAQDIYERYLNTTSQQQIHVDQELVKEVAGTLSAPPLDPFDCKLFDKAQDAIENVLVSDCMLRFKEILKTSNPSTFPQCPSALASKLQHYYKLSPVCKINKQRPQVSPSIFSSLLSLFHSSNNGITSPPLSPINSPPTSPILSPRTSPTLPISSAVVNAVSMPRSVTTPPPLSLSPTGVILIPKSKSPNSLSVLIPSASPPSSPHPSPSNSPPAAVPTITGFTFSTQSQTVPSYRVSMHRLNGDQHSPPQPISPAAASINTNTLRPYHHHRASAPEAITGFSVEAPSTTTTKSLESLAESPTPLSPLSPHSNSASSLPLFCPTVPSTQLEVLNVLAGHRSVPSTPVLESTKDINM